MVSAVNGLAETAHSKCAGSPSPTITRCVIAVMLKNKTKLLKQVVSIGTILVLFHTFLRIDYVANYYIKYSPPSPLIVVFSYAIVVQNHPLFCSHFQEGTLNVWLCFNTLGTFLTNYDVTRVEVKTAGI